MSEESLDLERVSLPRKESKAGLSRQTSRAGSPDLSQLDPKKMTSLTANRKKKTNGIGAEVSVCEVFLQLS